MPAVIHDIIFIVIVMIAFIAFFRISKRICDRFESRKGSLAVRGEQSRAKRNK